MARKAKLSEAKIKASFLAQAIKDLLELNIPVGEDLFLHRRLTEKQLTLLYNTFKDKNAIVNIDSIHQDIRIFESCADFRNKNGSLKKGVPEHFNFLGMQYNRGVITCNLYYTYFETIKYSSTDMEASDLCKHLIDTLNNRIEYLYLQSKGCDLFKDSE